VLTQPTSKVIITTAYPQFAVDAFELDVTDYLVKPIRFERFFKAINKVQTEPKINRSKITPEEDYIFIRSERKYIRSNYSEIGCIEGLKDYVIIHCGGEKHIVATNLKTIHRSLPEHLFVRISKSYVINVSKIKSIDHQCVMINTQKIPIGDNYKTAVTAFLNQKKILKR
jgi:DNA-binding LytR/AlgR family response regulator